ncbi:hypothetical protein FF011L_28660 [Roseimaritima multifibrata]|uniref:Uncharacterized protein n=1 Tax=Roseimaritima multifibrata TaxID=1930274 RepID=A0A517MGS1_9BACT|nr:hypothetical protein [Roseimaritima multifibrata]QDS94088.1 hypothetical protein FF011L_28660 [Roseimaritima multifibrata]
MSQPLHQSDRRQNRAADDEELLDEKAPGSPFLLVALSYMAIMAVVCLAIAGYFWLT